LRPGREDEANGSLLSLHRSQKIPPQCRQWCWKKEIFHLKTIVLLHFRNKTR
jgi:hypothetical protein